MAVQWGQVIKIRGALRGASGATAMLGAKRARFIANTRTAVSQAGGAELPSDVYKQGAAPQVIIETENVAEALAVANAAMVEETLILQYATPAGNRKTTFLRVKAIDGGPSEFPPAESRGANVPLHQITFAVIDGSTGDTTLATAIVDATDT